MTSTNTQKQAARAFVREWSGEGYEKGETQRFWIDLLYTVFGIDNPTKMMEFELPVKTITKEKGSDIVVRLSGRRKTLPQRISPRQLSRLDDGLPPHGQARRSANPCPWVTDAMSRGGPFLLVQHTHLCKKGLICNLG